MTAGKTGRPAKPRALKVLHGDRKDRINDAEPIPSMDEVVRPGHLAEPVAEVWDRLAPDLIRKGVLTTWDVDAFESFCVMVVEHRKASADLDANGTRIVVPVKELRDGTVIYSTVKNPNWQVAKESAALIATLGGRFGLNPADRTSLKVGDGTQRDEDDDLLTG